MKIYNNEITCHRNETWTFDKVLVARDGAPYIVSSEWNNPYVILTVSSTRYDQKDRYIRQWWLDLDRGYNIDGELVTLPRFYSTRPVEISDFSSGLPEGYEANDAVFYTVDNDGNKSYARFDEETQSFVPYEFRIVKAFTQQETRDWVEQSYVYSLLLVAGDSMAEYIYNLCLDNLVNEGEDPADVIPDTLQGMYEALYLYDPEIVEGIDITCPLINYSSVQVILEPTKLTVLSDIKGGM